MLLIIAIALVSIVTLACLGLFGLNRYLAGRPQDLALLPARDITQGGVPLRLLEPVTEEQKGRGLSGIEAVPADTALLLRSSDGDTRISMLGMRFALDLVWLDDRCTVVHVVEAAPARPLPLSYSSPHPAATVLELSVGDAACYGLDQPGARVVDCANGGRTRVDTPVVICADARSPHRSLTVRRDPTPRGARRTRAPRGLGSVAPTYRHH